MNIYIYMMVFLYIRAIMGIVVNFEEQNFKQNINLACFRA